jgi:hypothetical protein
MPKKVKTARGKRKTRKTNTLKVRVYKKYNKRGGKIQHIAPIIPATNLFPIIDNGAVKPHLPQVHIPVPTPVTKTLFATALLYSGVSDKDIPAVAELSKTDFFKEMYHNFSSSSIFPNLDKKKFAVILLTYIAALKNSLSDNQSESEIILPQGDTDDERAILLSDLKGLVDAIDAAISKRHQTRTGRTPHRPTSPKKRSPSRPSKSRVRRHTYGGGGSQSAEVGFSVLIMYLLGYLPERHRRNVRIVFAFIFMLWGIILIYNAVDSLFNIDDHMNNMVREARDAFIDRANAAAGAALVPYGAQVPAELQLQYNALPINTANSLHINFADIFSPSAQGRLVNQLVENIGTMMHSIIGSREYVQFQLRLQELINNVGQAIDASSAHAPNINADADAGFFTNVVYSLRNMVGQFAAIRYNVQHADSIVSHVISSGQTEFTRLFANLLADLTRMTQNLSVQLRVHLGANFDNLMIGTYMAVGYLLHILYYAYRILQERRQQREQRRIGNE